MWQTLPDAKRVAVSKEVSKTKLKGCVWITFMGARKTVLPLSKHSFPVFFFFCQANNEPPSPQPLPLIP